MSELRHIWYGLAQKRKRTMRWIRIWIGLIDKAHYYQAAQETPALRFIQPAPLATHSLWTVGLSGESLLWTDFNAHSWTSVGFQCSPSFPPACLGAPKVLAITWISDEKCSIWPYSSHFNAKPHIFKQSWNKKRVEQFLPPAPLLVSASAA